MWNEIVSQQDLDKFMNMICFFHDSCIKELKYISGAFVDNDLSMYPVNDQRMLKIIIQRQFENPSVIEMDFIGLKYLKLFPTDENYTCEILDATMILRNDGIYWCDCGYLSEKDFDTYQGNSIYASKVRWRSVDNYIGPKEVYASA